MGSSQKTNLLNSGIFINFALSVLILIWGYFSYHNWITDSEFWPVSLSGHWELWRQQPALMYKPLFHVVLSWIYLLKLSSFEHLQVAKFFFTALGALSFILFYNLCQKLGLTKRKSLLLTVIFLLSHVGFTQIGLIRSDFLIYLVLLNYLLLLPHTVNKSWFKQAAVSFLVSLVILLISPKGLYASALVFTCGVLYLSGWTAKFRFFLTYGWLFIITGFIAVQVFSNGEIEWLWNAVSNFAMDSFSDQASGFLGNEYTREYLKSDLLIWLAIIVGLVFEIFWFWKKRLSKQDVQCFLLGILSFGILLFHKPLLPFFIGSFWGILLVSIIPFIKHVNERALLGFMVISVIMFGARFSATYYKNNSVQLESIAKIEAFASKIPEAKIFDGLALGPRGPFILTYIGPDDTRAAKQAFNRVRSEKPALVIYANRLGLIEPGLTHFLKENYKQIGIGYYLRQDIQIEGNLEELKPAFFIFSFVPYSGVQN